MITYVPPVDARARDPPDRPIARRPDGEPVFRTQGDNNARADLRPFTLDRPTQARYAFAIPYVGYLFILLADPGGADLPARAAGRAVALSGSRGCGARPAGCWSSADEWLALAVALLALLTVPVSDANFNSRSANTATVTASSATQYFHIYSKATLPPADAATGCSSTRRGAAATPGARRVGQRSHALRPHGRLRGQHRSRVLTASARLHVPGRRDPDDPHAARRRPRDRPPADHRLDLRRGTR